MTFPFKLQDKQQWSAIEALLDTWFSQNFSRDSVLPFDSSSNQLNDVFIAAALFKRGAAGVRDTGTGNSFFPQTPTEPTNLGKAIFFKTWDLFVSQQLNAFSKSENLALVVDQKLLLLHPKIQETCRQLKLALHILDCNEDAKNLSQVARLCSQLNPNCQSILVIGGGICCDIAALAGSLLRLKIKLMPTTLLSLIDAGIGGKSGVNHPRAGKNQIGLFAQIDELICIDELLTTLSTQLLCDGLAEVMKHAWLSGNFEKWQPAIKKILTLSAEQAFADNTVQQLIHENIEFKKAVVQSDPFEKNLRVMLNLGHTVAHLLEALNLSHRGSRHYLPSLSHGIAVSFGLSSLIRCGLLKNPPEGFVEILERIQAPQQLSQPLFNLDDSLESAKSILLQDKKNTNRSQALQQPRVRCVLPSYGALHELPTTNTIEQFTQQNVVSMDPEVLIRRLIASGVIQ